MVIGKLVIFFQKLRVFLNLMSQKTLLAGY